MPSGIEPVLRLLLVRWWPSWVCAQPMRDSRSVTSYLIGWAHTQNDPCWGYLNNRLIHMIWCLTNATVVLDVTSTTGTLKDVLKSSLYRQSDLPKKTRGTIVACIGTVVRNVSIANLKSKNIIKFINNYHLLSREHAIYDAFSVWLVWNWTYLIEFHISQDIIYM